MKQKYQKLELALQMKFQCRVLYYFHGKVHFGPLHHKSQRTPTLALQGLRHGGMCARGFPLHS